MGGGTDPQKAIDEMDKALLPQPDDDIIAYIRSIIVSSMNFWPSKDSTVERQCPTSSNCPKNGHQCG
jgi:hypothetical protein